MKQKLVVLFAIICGIIVALAGCNFTDVKNSSNQTSVDEQKKTREKSNSNPSANKEQGLGDYNIKMTAKAMVEGEKIIVDGKSNLLPGTKIHLDPDTIYRTATASSITFMKISTDTLVEEDGTFHFEIDPLDNSNLRLYLILSEYQSDAIKEHYGENNKNVEGPLVYKEESFDGVIKKFARIETVLHLQDDVQEYEFTSPKVYKLPKDYGDQEVWIDAKVTNDHRYIYVQGKSNLLEGIKLKANYWSSESAFAGQSFVNSYTTVNQYGYFDLMIPYHSLTKQGFVKIESSPAVTPTVKTEIFKTYGEKYENLKGNLVKPEADGSKKIELILPLKALDVEVPKDVRITTEEQEMTMSVSDQLLFDYDKDELKPEAKEIINQLLNVLENQKSGTPVEVRGHTDDQGSDEYNQALSERRAKAVADYIMQSGKVSHLNISTKGFGETKPLESNADEEGRQKNRRVEIVINPK
ncbi:OmpA family protein [Schinkia sp. CFF1]